ncbi:MAG: DNA internalization-related competence protein ComEC/Rec2 [Pseudomonadota bacterium]
MVAGPPSPAPAARGGLLGPMLVAWIGGSGLQLLQPRLWDGAAYAALAVPAVVLAALLVARPAAGVRKRAALCGLAALLGAFALCGLRAGYFAAAALSPALEGRDLVLTGTVAAMPQRNVFGLRLRFAVDSATLEGAPVAVPPLVELGWYGTGAGLDPLSAGDGPPDLRAGEHWVLPVRLKAPHGARNPHGFDYELLAWEQGVGATGTVRAGRAGPGPRRLSAGWGHPVELARQHVRDAIFARLAPAAGNDPQGLAAERRAAGVVAARVTGDQRAIVRADGDTFRATGVAHLMSISGLHITMFAWLAAAAIGWLWRRAGRLALWLPAQHAALIGGVVLAGAYAVFSGGGLPSQRTVAMLATVALLRMSGRAWPWPLVWLLACAVVVAFDPWALLQAGFWLSFVAVGVLFATDAGARAQAATSLAGRWGAAAWALLREQLVVTLALAPLTLLLFGQASLVGLPANLLAIPWVTLVVTPLAMLGVLVPPLWNAAAWAVEMLGLVLAGLAALPHATAALPIPPLWATAAAVCGGALLCMRLPPALRLLGIAPLLPALLWSPARPAPGTFDVLAADIGQGSAALVRTASHALLYDTGPRFSADSDAGSRVLVPLLQAGGVRLDTVVVSHRDNDHAGGAAAVLAQQPQARFLSSIEATNPLQALRPAERCVAGQHWEWDGVRFSILHPQPEAYAVRTASNALSCVLRIEAAGGAVLLAGDIEEPQEAALVAAGAPLAADLLLAPHHGSRGSSSAPFLAAVAPRVAFAQAGYRNRYGHPAPQALARYAAQGAPLGDSPHCGAAHWSSERPAALECEREIHRRYWQHDLFQDGRR